MSSITTELFYTLNRNSEHMKILAFVDLHESRAGMKHIEQLAKKEKPRFICCLGDFTVFEDGVERLMRWMDALAAKQNTHILIIHGNHESGHTIARLAKKFKHMTFVHKRIESVDNVLFVGFGGGGFAMREEEFDAFAKKAASELKTAGKEKRKIVLMTHAPPYGTALDLLWEEHRGCKSYRDFIKAHRPALVLCGHFHENAGVRSKSGVTTLANPGPGGAVFTI